jgi:choline kinase
MKAVILAAGVASRLRPMTNRLPKCLLQVGKQSILERTIHNLLANNIDDIIIVTGFLEQQIKDFVKRKFPALTVRFIYNDLYDSTNNIYSLWLALKNISDEDMLLLDSDIVFDHRIISRLLDSGYTNCLALKRHAVGEEEIKVKTDRKGRILEIGKEVEQAEAGGESIGIELFGKKILPELFKIIDRKVVNEKNINQFYEAAFQELINQHADIHIVDISDYFSIEIDTEKDLLDAGKLFAG